MISHSQVNRFMTRSALISLGAMACAASFSSLTAAAPSSVPDKVAACYPKVPPVSNASISNVVKERQNTYYLLSSDQSEGGSDLLISVDSSNRCSLLLFNPMGDPLPLSRFVPVSVARQFALQQAKQGLSEAGSRQAYARQIARVKIWTPEEQWAVQELGFALPKDIQVIAPEDVKVSPEQGTP